MARLTPTERDDRLALDYRTSKRLVSPALAEVRAFGSEAELRAGHEVTPAAGEAGRAVLYLVRYAFPVLVAPGSTTDGAVARIDLTAGGNYPFSAPQVTIVTRPLPWSPHVHGATGTVCLGDGWGQARGRMLAAQLVVHVMRLLNCDEPDRDPSYVGWNAAAIQYWRTTMGRRPLHPDLQYPALPAEITHGAVAEEVVFRESGFRTTGETGVAKSEGTGFRPLGTPALGSPSGFRPLGGAG